MVLIAQDLVSGILVGLIYSLMAAGLTLEFGVLKVVNFGYGALYAFGGYVVVTMTHYLGLNFWVGLIIAMIVMFGVGMAIQKIGFSRFRSSELATLVFGVGVMLAGRAAFILIWGAVGKGITPPLSKGFQMGSVLVSYPRLVAAVVCIVVLGLLNLFLRRSSLGKAMRGVSDSVERAELQGINSSRIYMLAMGMGTAISAVAATFIATILVVGPEVDIVVLFKGFIIIILAGMGSIPGALVGGLIIGLVESYSYSYLPVQYGYAIPFALLVLVLLLRPQGLFGKKERVG